MSINYNLNAGDSIVLTANNINFNSNVIVATDSNFVLNSLDNLSETDLYINKYIVSSGTGFYGLTTSYYTGPTGPGGIQYSDSDIGDTGNTGATGDIGPQGFEGLQGFEGPKGPPGEQGPPETEQGEKGDIGPTGPTGPTGPNTQIHSTFSTNILTVYEKPILTDNTFIFIEPNYEYFTTLKSPDYDTSFLTNFVLIPNQGNGKDLLNGNYFEVGVIKDNSNLDDHTGTIEFNNANKGSKYGIQFTWNGMWGPYSITPINNSTKGTTTTLSESATYFELEVKNKKLIFKYLGGSNTWYEIDLYTNIFSPSDTLKDIRFYFKNVSTSIIKPKFLKVLVNNYNQTSTGPTGPTGTIINTTDETTINIITVPKLTLNSSDSTKTLESYSYIDEITTTDTPHYYTTIDFNDQFCNIEVLSIINGANKQGFIKNVGLYKYLEDNSITGIAGSKDYVGNISGNESSIEIIDGALKLKNEYVALTGNMKVVSNINLIKYN